MKKVQPLGVFAYNLISGALQGCAVALLAAVVAVAFSVEYPTLLVASVFVVASTSFLDPITDPVALRINAAIELRRNPS